MKVYNHLSETGLINISQINWAKRLSRRKTTNLIKLQKIFPQWWISLREYVDDGILKEKIERGMD